MKASEFVGTRSELGRSEYLNTSVGAVELGLLARPVTHVVQQGGVLLAVFDHHPTAKEVEDAVAVQPEVREAASQPKTRKGKAVEPEEEADPEPEEVSDGEESE